METVRQHQTHPKNSSKSAHNFGTHLESKQTITSNAREAIIHVQIQIK